MEDARAGGSNGNHRDRRRTVSGAIPQVNDERQDVVTPIDEMRFPWSNSPSAPTSPTKSSTPSPQPATASPKERRHRHTFSGGFLAKFNLLRNGGGELSRSSSRAERPASRDKESTSPTKSVFGRKSVEDDAPPTSPTSPKTERENALASALKPNKTRKRKGSLRKTALLGGRRNVTEGRERKGSFSLLPRSSSTKQALQQAPQNVESPTVLSDGDGAALEPASGRTSLESRPSMRRQFSYEHPEVTTSTDSGWSEPAAVSAARLRLLTEHQQQQAPLSGSPPKADDLASPVDELKSPTSQTSYASTTSEDDGLTFDRPVKPLPLAAPSMNGTTTSYFASETSSLLTTHRRSSKRSPLSRTIPMSAAYPEPVSHDYTETEYWGWVILFVTWIVFVSGMGSCLGVWSWAWDVGETPYAPPDLEDDETLPIVGYYPALIVLTGVVAWVWITVAWVGMKYFRHARVEV